MRIPTLFAIEVFAKPLVIFALFFAMSALFLHDVDYALKVASLTYFLFAALGSVQFIALYIEAKRERTKSAPIRYNDNERRLRRQIIEALRS